MILLHFKNACNSGIDVTLVYDPVFDGPIERYQNMDNVTIEYVNIVKN